MSSGRSSSIGEDQSVHDSQVSDSDSLIIVNEIQTTQEQVELSSTDEELSSEDSNLLREDELFKRTAVKKENLKRRESHSSEENSISVKQYDLGRHFDPQIISSMEKIELLNKQIDNSFTKDQTITLTSNLEKTTLRYHLKRSHVSDYYIDLIIKESISGKYLDWHFITENCYFEELSPCVSFFSCGNGKLEATKMLEKYPSLKDLLLSFGVSEATMDMLSTKESPITCTRQHDTLCEISPTESMMHALSLYNNDNIYFLKYFICFILDRKVYESMDCDMIWCTKIYNTLSKEHFTKVYMSLVDKQDYLMHYRLIRLIPAFQKPLVRQLFFEEKELDSKESIAVIVKEFNELFDKRHFQKVLYFILVVYGSQYMPFGQSSVTRYFKCCTDDMSDENTNEVELSLLKGLLSIFTKIQS